MQEKDIQGRDFGLIYFSDEKRKKGQLSVGKVLRRFCLEKDSGIQYLEMECLKFTPRVQTVLEKNLPHFDCEIGIISA